MKRLLVCVFVMAVASLTPPATGMASQQDKSANDLLKALEALGREMEQINAGEVKEQPPIVMISESGTYPPGPYIGRCEARRAPEEKHIGDRYEVRYVSSGFFRLQEDGTWNGIGSSQPRGGVSWEECSPDDPEINFIHLGGPGKHNIRGPGQYKLVVNGYVEQYYVKKCITVGGGPCPNQVSREEIHYEIPFEIVAGN